MSAKQLVLLALQISIVATVLGFGLRATVSDLLYLWRRPGLLGRSLLAMLVALPVVAVLLVMTFELRHAIEVALVALAISPVPPLLPNREGKAGGYAPYALGLMATLSAGAIVFVPVAARILQGVFGRPLGMSVSSIAPMMLVMVLLPLAVGVALRSFAPALAERIAGPVATFARLLLPLAALPLLIVALPAMWRLVGDGTILAIAAFVVAGLAIGHVLGGPEPEQAAVLALSTACRHPAIALAIASTNFPEERFGGAILLYLLLNLIVSMPYVTWQRKRLTAVPLA
jgi:BASS family bile acid:Na+ symporter